MQEIGVGLVLGQFTAVVAVGDYLRQSTPPHLGLRLLVHVSLVLVEEQTCRLDISADPAQITGDVNHGAHQGRDADLFESRGNGAVIVGERFPSVGVAVIHRVSLPRPRRGCQIGMDKKEPARKRGVGVVEGP